MKKGRRRTAVSNCSRASSGFAQGDRNAPDTSSTEQEEDDKSWLRAGEQAAALEAQNNRGSGRPHSERGGAGGQQQDDADSGIEWDRSAEGRQQIMALESTLAERVIGQGAAVSLVPSPFRMPTRVSQTF